MSGEGTRESANGLSRRSVVKRLGVGTAAIWSAPAIITVSQVAATGSGPPCKDPDGCGPSCEKLRLLKKATIAFLEELKKKCKTADEIAKIDQLIALAIHIYDAALEKLKCCP